MNHRLDVRLQIKPNVDFNGCCFGTALKGRQNPAPGKAAQWLAPGVKNVSLIDPEAMNWVRAWNKYEGLC